MQINFLANNGYPIVQLSRCENKLQHSFIGHSLVILWSLLDQRSRRSKRVIIDRSKVIMVDQNLRTGEFPGTVQFQAFKDGGCEGVDSDIDSSCKFRSYLIGCCTLGC